jgi:hypothetical protein
LALLCRVTVPSFNRVLGLACILLSLLCNEWVVRAALDIERIGWAARTALLLLTAGLLGWGIVAFRGASRPWVTNLHVAGLATLVSVGAVECALRVWPTLLSPEYANGVRTKYHDGPGGIYYYDPSARQWFMWPEYRTQMYYNGYTWTHETDALGFRNRRVQSPVDIVLLGDSFIYGHGVDLEGTVGHFLEQCSRATVMNLGRQGHDAYSEAYLLTDQIGTLRPRIILLFFMENDVRGLLSYLTTEELVTFTATPVEAIRFPPRLPFDAARQRNAMRWQAQRRDRTLGTWLRQETALGRILDWRAFERAAVAAHPARQAAETDETSVPWQVTKHAIRYMRWLAARHGARFVLAPITPFMPRHRDILRRFTQAEGIEWVDTVVTEANPDWFLVEGGRPGHLSPRGAHVMAEAVCRHLGYVGEREVLSR